MGKENKKALKEAKRLAQLAAEIEAAKQLRRDEMLREMAVQSSIRGKLDETWRELMVKIKEPIFRQDIEIIRYTFERAYDKQDHIILYTMKLMDSADNQFQRTISSFCVTIDTMINKFLDDLKNISHENNIKISNLLSDGENDTALIMSNQNNAETHLQLMLFHGHSTAEALTWKNRGENIVKQDDERYKCLNQREDLRFFLQNHYVDVWEEYKAVIKSYVSEIGNNQKEVRKLRRIENLMADIIASQGKRLANSVVMLKRLRTELAAYESGTKQAVFRDRRNRHRVACRRLKKHMAQGFSIDRIKLNLLVEASDNSIEWLESAVKKGEKILRMAAFCRKYETLREKVIPFGSYLSPTCTKTNLHESTSDDSLVANAISSTCGLTRLWQRISQVELAKRALYQEKCLLEQENLLLINKIQKNNENKMEMEISNCLCGDSKKKRAIIKPVAIEGVLEIHKFYKDK